METFRACICILSKNILDGPLRGPACTLTLPSHPATPSPACSDLSWTALITFAPYITKLLKCQRLAGSLFLDPPLTPVCSLNAEMTRQRVPLYPGTRCCRHLVSSLHHSCRGGDTLVSETRLPCFYLLKSLSKVSRAFTPRDLRIVPDLSGA